MDIRNELEQLRDEKYREFGFVAPAKCRQE